MYQLFNTTIALIETLTSHLYLKSNLYFPRVARFTW